MSLRRLAVLVWQLPPDAALWAEVRVAHEAAQKPTADKIRERQAHYAAQGH